MANTSPGQSIEAGAALIENAEMVIAALSAGAAAGMTGTASKAVADAYEGLKSLTTRALLRFKDLSENADVTSTTTAIEEQLADPETHRSELLEALTSARAGEDQKLVAAALRVLSLVPPGNTDSVRIDVHDNQGVQIGNNPVMHLRIDK